MKTSLQGKYRILVASGVNLDLLGSREPGIYGSKTLDWIHQDLRDRLSALEKFYGLQNGSIFLDCFQTNDETKFIEKLRPNEYEGIVINAGAWTHTSLAIADRLKGLSLPYVEVHLSELLRREPFRQKSLLALGAAGRLSGFGYLVYRLGLVALLDLLQEKVVKVSD